ncbi:MAG TPA: cytochrome P450 [Actinomycetota bacterium]|nr:cytochrome P450 [Actinomycetota bacterium]
MSSDESRIDLTTLHVGPLQRLLGRGIERSEPGPYFERVGKLLLFRDPPDHTRLRALVNRAFTPRRVMDLEPRIEAIAHDTIDTFVADGEVELMTQFAYPFPARVICELMGVPRNESHHIIDHAPSLAGGLDPGPLLTPAARDAANAACEAIVDYLDGLIRRRREDPGDDLLSALLDRHDGDALSHDELVDTVLLLLIAGHETTANLLGNGIVVLLDQPEALAELRADRDLDRAAVDELLRFDSPVQMTMRVATEGSLIDGRPVSPGSVVILVTGAANRDGTVFEQPDRLDWHRGENPHVAFGGGLHYCLGAALARAEARIALRALLDRLPNLVVAGEPLRRPSFTIRALSRLPLGWRHTPAPVEGPLT